MATDRQAEYLVVAPHPDDAELGMGGTIIKLIRAGKRVAVVDLTSGEPFAVQETLGLATPEVIV